MRIYLGVDHAGFQLKEHVRQWLEAQGHDVVDVGTHDEESVDYPDYARDVALAVGGGEADLGVLVCGTGFGMAIAANKFPGIRAVPVSDPEMARMARRHNNANIITLAGRFLAPEKAEEILDAFLSAEYENGRHQRRIDKISAFEDSQR